MFLKQYLRFRYKDINFIVYFQAKTQTKPLLRKSLHKYLNLTIFDQ